MSTLPPSESLSTRRQLELLRDLQRIATARHEVEQQVASDFLQATTAADKRAQAAQAKIDARFEKQKNDLEQQLGDERHQLTEAYQSERSDAQQRYHTLRDQAESERRHATEEARRRSREEAWEILAVFDAQKGQPQQREAERLAGLRDQLAEVQTLKQEASTILTMRRMPIPSEVADSTPVAELLAEEDPSSASGLPFEERLADVTTRVARVRELATKLYKQKLARLFEGLTPVGIVIGLAVVSYVAAAATLGPADAIAIAVGIAAVAFGGAVLWWSARPFALRAAQDLFQATRAEATAAEAAIQTAFSATRAQRRAEAVALIEKRKADLASLGFEIEQTLGETKLRVTEQLGSAGELFPAKLTQLRDKKQSATAQIDARLTGRLSELAEQHGAEVSAIEQRHHEEQQAAVASRDQAWHQLSDTWREGYQAIQQEAAAMRLACDERFPSWLSEHPPSFTKQQQPTLAVEFGRATVDLKRIKSGLSDDERLHPEETTVEFPTLVTLTDEPTLVVTASGAGKPQAARLLQAMALRWLVGQPPGKVRLTVLDPSGLGEGFASLMHLADYDENLIAGRIWSEARDIDEQLLRLTTHLETVIQKYLRSEYDSIHDYNAQAGEVAEPFQVLLINGFPSNFSDVACRRLLNLAASGPRCGVYVMLAADREAKPPHSFQMEDLLSDAVHIDWLADAKRFVWRYPAFEHLPLTVAEPPSDEQMVQIVRQAGEAAKAAIRVEVPFEAVAPVDESLWRSTCDHELRIPVGRAGANRLQDVRLGKGTSQHLLVAGKTGSGKSTFLHALVTSAALRYSPAELEFYLVDFKKGVEFKSYATHRLPHARVVAIESEREFGISVLQRLDEELTRRGEQYREAGVQTLADYRAARPQEETPRLLLVIDEFQELFVEDDKLAQEATLLLDRLVRQGRAFGVHVLLGTQTLAGAYSLARSTLGQIAIRVALACSEADAHLILSDERNQAARFLSRPGEAIYNDQNGLVSANEPFQVVWLPDSERAEWLAKVDAQREATSRASTETIVFEGNMPADVAANHELAALLAGNHDPVASTSQRGYLGAAVAIKSPTAAEFGRHGGANLLIIGNDQRAAIGMITASLVSLAAASPTCQIVLADGGRQGEPLADYWPAMGDALPGNFQRVVAHELSSAVNDIAVEVARREAASQHDAPPVYLVLHHAGRFRDLRRTDDDFSFSVDKDKPPSPDKQLATILREGPGLGVHVIVWCDGWNAATRLFDRATLREFALRVAMPMSAADSSNFIDTPLAANLNQHRALLYNDETGQAEKFRPYGLPDEAWRNGLLMDASGS